jgi:hypothetical protein
VAIKVEHEIHHRRFGRNLGVAVLLAGFVAVTFALTVVKVKRGDPMQAYDHVVRPEMATGTAATP